MRTHSVCSALTPPQPIAALTENAKVLENQAKTGPGTDPGDTMMLETGRLRRPLGAYGGSIRVLSFRLVQNPGPKSHSEHINPQFNLSVSFAVDSV